MQLKRFTAENISKALEMVKAELGSNAIILSTEKKRKKDPDSNSFVSYTEVVAAVDRNEGLGQNKGRGPLTVISPKDTNSHDDTATRLKDLAEEVQDMKKALARISGLLERALLQEEDKTQGSHPEGDISRHMEIDMALSTLKLDPETYRIVSSGILSSLGHRDITYSRVISWLKTYIAEHLHPGPVAEDSPGPVWWAFIGPTGVGKTTTLAKIAARLKFLKKRNGLLVSVDSYRLGAIDQLRKYAELMELPLEIAKTNKDLLRIFSMHRDKDFVLLDTTGRNPFTSAHKIELERIFDAVPGLMAQVMLCSTYKREDLMESINFYRGFPIAGWTLTKTDETRSLAASLFPVIQADLPLSYLTNGQRVPEDIEIPEGRKLCDELLISSSVDIKTSSLGISHLNATVC